jgi:hypothetical protein
MRGGLWPREAPNPGNFSVGAAASVRFLGRLRGGRHGERLSGLGTRSARIERQKLVQNNRQNPIIGLAQAIEAKRLSMSPSDDARTHRSPRSMRQLLPHGFHYASKGPWCGSSVRSKSRTKLVPRRGTLKGQCLGFAGGDSTCFNTEIGDNLHAPGRDTEGRNDEKFHTTTTCLKMALRVTWVFTITRIGHWSGGHRDDRILSAYHHLK